MANHKIDRISSDILKYLNNIILTETRDEIFKSITLIDVEVTKDLSFAYVYFTSISDRPKEEVIKELNDSASFLRGKLARVIELRNIPKLIFKYDESIEYANNIENIIKEIHKES